MEVLIRSMGEVKSELVAVAHHLQNQNGSLQRHFRDDLEWQQTHSIEHSVKALAVAKEEGRVEGKASLRKSDVALLTVIIAVVSSLVTVVSRLA